MADRGKRPRHRVPQRVTGERAGRFNKDKQPFRVALDRAGGSDGAGDHGLYLVGRDGKIQAGPIPEAGLGHVIRTMPMSRDMGSPIRVRQIGPPVKGK